ncbi:MAG: S46 family peptidase [Flavobacteriales bacterium]
MKKILSLFLAVSLVFTSINVKADEGMWLPMFIKRLNIKDMQSKGLKLSAEEIYSVNNSSLKDAIISLGGFCTGEIISDQGLMLTNHHCGYDAIQQFSTVANNYLRDGFWAMKKTEEKNVPGLTATFLVRMEDVTEQILEGISGLDSRQDKAKKIKEIQAELIKKATDGTNYTAYIKDFFYGSEYYMFINETYTDVRLVGAPPESVGKYGGDTDNWMWPRHTGDFTLFRIYSGKDGKPSDYSADNIPLKPKHHLPVNIKGVKEGDFAMIMGYPGSTDRYLSSFGVQQAIDKKGPTVVEVRDVKLKTMKAQMDKKESIDIMYSSKYAQTANYWKYFQGQTEQLQTNAVVERKTKLERDFENWYGQTPELTAKYGDALRMIREYYELTDQYIVGNTYVMEAGLRGPDFVLYTYRTDRIIKTIAQTRAKFDAKIETATGEEKEALIAERDKTVTSLVSALEEMTTEHFKNYDEKTEKNLVANLFDLYYNKVSKDQHPPFFADVKKANFDRFAKKLFCKSPFMKEKKMNKVIAKLKAGKAIDMEDDKAIKAATDFISMYFGSSSKFAEAEQDMEEGYRLFVEGIRLMQPEKSFYPNANSTQRLTYGSVMSYEVSDKVKEIVRSKDGLDTYYTTMEGLIEKEIPGDQEFSLPTRLKELYAKKDYGQYADADGKLRVNFLTNNDITGGNSGSPVIDGNGYLIGTAFDGNWEAMSGDISFENKVQRTISVDIRYTLFIIDKYAGAGHLVEEMTVIK